MQINRPKSDSLAALGLRRFMDERWYKYGGYLALTRLFEADKNNAEIGRQFGPPDRPVTKEAVRTWRARWELEKKYPELSQGGTEEDANDETA